MAGAMALLKALCGSRPGRQAASKGDATAALEALMRLHRDEEQLQSEASELVALLRSKGGKGGRSGKEARPNPLTWQSKRAKAPPKSGAAAGGAPAGRTQSEVVTAEYLY